MEFHIVTCSCTSSLEDLFCGITCHRESGKLKHKLQLTLKHQKQKSTLGFEELNKAPWWEKRRLDGKKRFQKCVKFGQVKWGRIHTECDCPAGWTCALKYNPAAFHSVRFVSSISIFPEIFITQTMPKISNHIYQHLKAKYSHKCSCMRICWNTQTSQREKRKQDMCPVHLEAAMCPQSNNVSQLMTQPWKFSCNLFCLLTICSDTLFQTSWKPKYFQLQRQLICTGNEQYMLLSSDIRHHLWISFLPAMKCLRSSGPVTWIDFALHIITGSVNVPPRWVSLMDPKEYNECRFVALARGLGLWLLQSAARPVT